MCISKRPQVELLSYCTEKYSSGLTYHRMPRPERERNHPNATSCLEPSISENSFLEGIRLVFRRLGWLKNRLKYSNLGHFYEVIPASAPNSGLGDAMLQLRNEIRQTLTLNSVSPPPEPTPAMERKAQGSDCAHCCMHPLFPLSP